MTTAKTTPVRPRVGDVIAAKYRIERLIGEGGMGEVYEAHHLLLNERVALKTLVGSLATSSELKLRFLREAQATAKLRNEHVVSIFDVGELPNGAPYIVMEYLEGHDLANYPTQPKGQPVHEIVDHVLQASEALAEAHVKGIIHRDLKPSNLFLTTGSDGSACIKVLDFGISKIAENDDGLTGTNESIGTLRYMSPEQLHSSRNVDPRTDIWSLGVVLFELLSHQLPFVADGGSLALAIVGRPPRPLAELRADLPRGLVEVVLRCLEKDRTRRFESISELAVALAPFGTDDARRSCERIIRIAGLPSRTVVSPPMAVLANPPAPNTAPGWVSGHPGTEKRYGAAIAATVGVAFVTAALVVAGIGVVRARQQHTASISASAHALPATLAEPLDAAPSTSASAPPTTEPASSSTPTPATSASSVPSSHPARPLPKPKPTATVADDRHG